MTTRKKQEKLRYQACAHAHDALAGYVARDPYAYKKQHIAALLADLLQFCSFEGVDFTDALRIARGAHTGAQWE